MAPHPKEPDGTLDRADDSADLRQRARMRVADLLSRSFHIRSVALTGLFVLAVFYTIYFMRSILLPIILALLLSYLLRPIVRALARIKIPNVIGSAVILLALLTGIGFGASALAGPTAAWLAKAPTSLADVQAKLRPVKTSMAKVEQASGEIEKITATGPEARQTVEVRQHSLRDMLYLRTPELIADLILLIILLYFLLAYDGVFMNKVVRLLPTLQDKKKAVAIAHDIESHISRYLLAVTLINCALGVAVGTVVGLLGLPNPVLWGIFVAVLNFVPYLGALSGIFCMTVAALLSFNSVGYAFIFPGVYLALGTIEGNFVTPWVMGRSLTLNPVIILLSLAFWGWMWGIVGVIVAVPILAAFKIFCSHTEPMEPIAEFLS